MAENPSLTILSGALSGQRIDVDLSTGEAVIGSDPTCAVHIDDPAVSPRHALLQASGNEVLIQSADYASEVLVNGNAIAWLTPVNAGDEISLGGVTVRYGGEGEAGAAPAPKEDVPAFDFGADPFAEEPPSTLDLGGDEPEEPPPPPPPPPPEDPPEESKSLQLKDPDPPALKLKDIPEPPRVEEPEEEEMAPAPPPAPRPRPAAPRRPVARTAGRPARVQRVPIGRYLIIGLVAVAVIGAGVWFGLPLFMAPRLDSVAPVRVPVGQTVVLQGDYFGSSPEGLVVNFGNQAGQVLEVSRRQIVVEVPELEMGAAGDLPVPVTVSVGSRQSTAQQISVFQAPRVTVMKPDVAMPGDEIAIQGGGWGEAAQVSFDEATAEVISVDASEIRVRVPALEGASASVRVLVGGLSSPPVPFLVGRLPLITGAEPSEIRAGGRLELSGRGLGDDPRRTLAQIGGIPALVVAASGDALSLVVPRGPEPGEVELELRVPGTENVGRVALQLGAESGPLGFHFVPEPFTLAGAEGRDRAVVVSDVGTRLVLAGDTTQLAGARAAAVAERLNAAAERLAGGAAIEVRDLETAPAIAVTGETEPLLTVTEADAEAHNESWARASRRSSGPTVTRERLARWWGAVLADLALVLARGQAPTESQALATEGRALQQLYDAANGRPPRGLLASRATLRESLRTLALRVPASVPGAAAVAAASSPAQAAADPGAPPPGGFELDGIWVGATREAGRRREISATFRGAGGELTYMGGVALSQPLVSVSRKDNEVRFAIRRGQGEVHFQGIWDGQKLSGAMSSQASGGGDVGTFELYRR